MNNKLSKEFYDKNALVKAIRDYKNLASISLSEDEQYYYYEVQSSRYDVILVANEFENYVLGLMNS